MDWSGYDERRVLLRYLGKNRDAVVRATEGLDDADLRRSPVPSGTNLLGMVQHLTWIEEHWFQRVFLGHDPVGEDSWDVPAGRSHAEVVAAYRAACARSDEILRSTPDLATLARAENPGEAGLSPLRMIAAHMVEETARHAGHADILRELIDGTTDD